MIFINAVLTLEIMVFLKLYLSRVKTLKAFISTNHSYTTEVFMIKDSFTKKDFSSFINIISIFGLTPEEFFMNIKSKKDLKSINRNPAVVNKLVLSEKIHGFYINSLCFTSLLALQYAKKNMDVLDKARINIHQYREAKIEEKNYQQRIDLLEESKEIDIYFNAINKKKKKGIWDDYYDGKLKYLKLKLNEQREEIRKNLLNQNIETKIIAENETIDLLKERRELVNEKKEALHNEKELKKSIMNQKLKLEKEFQKKFIIDLGIKQLVYLGKTSDLHRYGEYFEEQEFLNYDEELINVFCIAGREKQQSLHGVCKINWYGKLIQLTYFFKLLQNKSVINKRINVFSFISSCFTNSEKLIKSKGKGQMTEFNTLKIDFLNEETLEPKEDAPDHIKSIWNLVNPDKQRGVAKPS